MTKIEFFKKTSIWWVLPISFGMSLLGWCVYEPSSVPHKELGILGKLTRELVDNYPVLLQVTWYAAVAAHVGEAIYAYKLASKMNIKEQFCKAWFVQTLFFGYASLMHLKEFEGEQIKSK
ncbi:Oidioi.mRNA.OKI2018_I69.PAR.g10888.t1.cds [Oikopleura dioica]|uniref:Transmembrane protein 254 n=1 Tax=Oikopleura dioica TaxID=34765 RepID=A0ABN7RWX0_OIKDI|nr:Oidioi.mRNA.OKI2018_I69.PAR.g10888.t1.cds [Oikopleura dioica]